jgi:hypothetical protein
VKRRLGGVLERDRPASREYLPEIWVGGEMVGGGRLQISARDRSRWKKD